MSHAPRWVFRELVPSLVVTALVSAGFTTWRNQTPKTEIAKLINSGGIRIEFQMAFDRAVSEFLSRQDATADACRPSIDHSRCALAMDLLEMAWKKLEVRIATLNQREREFNTAIIEAIPKTLSELHRSWQQRRLNR